MTQVALGVDHSVFLTGSNGGVWTCGLNTGGQLGQGAIGSSLGAPAMIKLKDTVAVGVAAARYHSVFWTRSGTVKIVAENIQRNSLKGHWLLAFLFSYTQGLLQIESSISVLVQAHLQL